MDYNKEIETLEAKRDELEAQLNTKGISEQKELAIHQQISDYTKEITMLYSKLPEDSDIVIPFFGWTIFGVPVALFWCWRFGRVSWFKYRHARVPYPDDVVATYCQKFELPIASFKEKSHLRWQQEAVKSGLYGTFAFGMIAWNTLVSWSRGKKERK